MRGGGGQHTHGLLWITELDTTSLLARIPRPDLVGCYVVLNTFYFFRISAYTILRTLVKIMLLSAHLLAGIPRPLILTYFDGSTMVPFHKLMVLLESIVAWQA